MDIKVLIVDDEELLLESLSTTLSMAGYFVATVNSANLALERLKGESFHILLTDINMPKKDGLELLEEAKKIAPTLEVIMMTAYTTISKVILSWQNGACDYILKPFSDIDEVERVLERASYKVQRWNELLAISKKK